MNKDIERIIARNADDFQADSVQCRSTYYLVMTFVVNFEKIQSFAASLHCFYIKHICVSLRDTSQRYLLFSWITNIQLQSRFSITVFELAICNWLVIFSDCCVGQAKLDLMTSKAIMMLSYVLIGTVLFIWILFIHPIRRAVVYFTNLPYISCIVGIQWSQWL